MAPWPTVVRSSWRRTDNAWPLRLRHHYSQLQLSSRLRMLIELWKTALTIFIIFGMKLGDYKVRIVTEPDFPKKIRFPGNWAKTGNFYSKSDSLIFSSKFPLRILLIFGVKLGLYKGFKLAETNFSKKCRFPGKWEKNGNFYSKSDYLISH